MNFVDMTILTELDNWIGDMILQQYPEDEEIPDGAEDVPDINEYLGLHSKLSLLRDDLSIVLDFNNPLESKILRVIEKVSEYLPTFLLPFISLYLFKYLIIMYDPDRVKMEHEYHTAI
eukprot:CAMPEP_0170515636 /NCGR_PEP_ID=MMETSP0209-20121228/2048_1 /TAXON_ID=665100 ORGANISM="Litonotus pictus, Strain P1" /NCGR_SAMPLE_ID=MMETSP0209 /ASSEMBLY_ACC=CAM_ASM_000301 /LENGTH=117 /DNA_ID=CAMNT_0010800215 /DNA_START=780 /DNA_END=1133 /DNA_ORIENTATION=+